MKLTLPQVCKLSLIILLFVVGLFIAGVVFPLINLFFTANPAKNIRDHIKKQWLCWFGKIINLHIEQEGCLPERTALIVSNHISWLDIIAIGRCLPAYFVAKSDILGWPVIGYLARQAGTIFIRRGDKQHILGTAERMVWLLKQNSHIIAFPEGTTTTGEEVRGFHASLFQPAMLTKSLVQPVAIEYLGETKALAPFIGDDEFVPHLVRMLLLDKIEVRLSFLPIINVSGKTRLAVCNGSRTAIIEKINGIAEESLVARSIGD